jgi:ferritin-like metal-binding protein YciE
MEGLIREGENTAGNIEDSFMMGDAGITITGRNIEHYRSFLICTLIHPATLPGQDEIANLLSQKLEEGKRNRYCTDKNFERNINRRSEREERKMKNR